MRISLIVAAAEGGVIGRDGGLPWRLPADLARFKRLTMGHHLVVGRKTWESIGRPLPGRQMVVVSRQDLLLPDGVALVGSPDEALKLARDAGESEVFVAGGGEIYRQLLGYAERIYMTRVLASVEGDAHFPEIPAGWEILEECHRPADEANQVDCAFVTYDRV